MRGFFCAVASGEALVIALPPHAHFIIARYAASPLNAR
ncbi:hypothetical protein A33K_13044 [Burkholderia humptydooensis MSMB43]|uniref:Uncharacterized protein n=1 Tax=Burkholderia humptydooensis MSMB43 TaxID=441157 RepID=A0ABN0GBF1_9BURK|nr:hypothetical protein A33K_13044 [Burkholderia humptydooensis MSMB43]